jgi:hypothetical protein
VNGNRAVRVAALAAAFAIALSLYLVTLAPTVTLEDSGELIAAAYTLGVPHSPGYPLFTMVGKVFSALPVGNVAYRLNLMSAFFSALGAMLLTRTAALVLDSRAGVTRASQSTLAWSAALAAGLWMATSFEVWEQSIITEVYTLNLAVVIAFLLMLVHRWRDPESDRYLYAACFFLGLALTTHSTSLILIPLFALHVVRNERASLDRRLLFRGVLAFLAGLTPYLYLPLASLRNPGIDWGNPETPTGLARTLFVRHLRFGSWPSIEEYLERLVAYGGLLADQWMPAFLLLAVIGLVALFRANRNVFWHTLLLLALSGPVVVLGTNIDVRSPDGSVAVENMAQASVFYIPSYAIVALLMGVGVYVVARSVAKHAGPRRVTAAAVVLLPLVFAYPTCKTVDMSDFRLAEDYAGNLFGVAGRDGLVLADWDPFYFPLVYYQLVELQRPDLVVLDQQLLRHSWYVEQVFDRHPGVGAAASTEIDAFLDAVRPFEDGRPHDGNEIQRRYEAMLRALVVTSTERGRDVYFAYDPPRGLTEGLSLESVGAARRVSKRPAEPMPDEIEPMRLRGLVEGRPVPDRWRVTFGDYYGELSYEQGVSDERLSRFGRALDHYRRAARLLSAHHPRLPEVRRQIERLERQLGR